MILSYHPAAQVEAADAAGWYAQERDRLLAEEFTLELESALRLIERHPAIGAPGVRQTRTFRLMRFPYTIVYRLDGDTVRALAIAHRHRRPGFWSGRR